MYDKELNDIITRFTDQMRSQYSGDSYAAGYFSAWVRQFGEADPQVRDRIIRQLTYTMEIAKNA
jgi:hypothetical protein